jgi:hypothetical protein
VHAHAQLVLGILDVSGAQRLENVMLSVMPFRGELSVRSAAVGCARCRGMLADAAHVPQVHDVLDSIYDAYDRFDINYALPSKDELQLWVNASGKVCACLCLGAPCCC